jgi:hypothetical protein
VQMAEKYSAEHSDKYLINVYGGGVKDEFIQMRD